MTGTELDDILAADTPQVEQETTTQTTDGPIRDEQGRFAPKVEAEAAPVVEQQVEAETGKVPQQALHAAREKAKEKDQENEQLRREMAELRGQIQLLSQRPSHQAPKPAEPERATDFWEDPNAFVSNALTPVQKAMRDHVENFSKRLAIKEHGREVVDAAYRALGAAVQVDPSARAELQRLATSDDPFEDIVQWHKRSQTLSMVGNDPNAWFEAEMEKRLSDPAFQAKVLERARGTAANNTNRSNPVTNLPPSLNRLPAGGNTAADADLSDAGLFASAMR